MLTDQQLRQFASDGYIVVPDVVPSALLEQADEELTRMIAVDPPPPDKVGHHFYFLPPSSLPAADAALRNSPALTIAESLVAPHRLEHALQHIQVALHIAPHSHVPGAPHIDGHNLQVASSVLSFSMLAAVYLGDELTPNSGCLWVWPGSHIGHQQLFRERGPDVLLPVDGHACFLEPPVSFGAGVPVFARRGDLLLAHYLLGHNIGGNTSDRLRRILYYRLGCDQHRGRSAQTRLDAWTEYEPVRRVVAAS